MPSLRDVVPTGERVLVGGVEFQVFGLTGRHLAALLERFSGMAKAVTGGDVAVSDILALGPECVAAVIACGMRKFGDKDEEDAIMDLTVGDQVDLLNAILKQTLTKGVAPFQKLLSDLGFKVQASSDPAASPGTAPASN